MAKYWYWHNSPIWAQLKEMGFNEHSTTAHGFGIGKRFAEKVVNQHGDRVILEFHERPKCTEVSVYREGLSHTVRRYTTIATYAHGRIQSRPNGAWADVLEQVKNLID